MAAAVKTDAPQAPAAKAEVAAAPLPPSANGASAWLAALATIVLAPLLTWGAVEYVMVPRLQKKLAATPTTPAGPAAGSLTELNRTKAANANLRYEFGNVMVNVAGTMGTRYLRATFVVTGTDPTLNSTFEAAKPLLTDVTINVLSSLTLADIEEPGAKNVIREKLVGAYNQALKRRVAEQVYFSDFVVQ